MTLLFEPCLCRSINDASSPISLAFTLNRSFVTKTRHMSFRLSLLLLWM